MSLASDVTRAARRGILASFENLFWFVPVPSRIIYAIFRGSDCGEPMEPNDAGKVDVSNGGCASTSLPSAYISVVEAISLLTGAPKRPCSAKRWKRQSFAGASCQAWGSHVLNCPIEQHGGERRHPLVRAMRQTIARARWRRTRGPLIYIIAERFSGKSPKLRAAAWRHALRAADPGLRNATRVLAQSHGQSLGDLLVELRADLRPLYTLRSAYAELVRSAVRQICSAAAEGRITVLGRLGRYDRGELSNGEHEVIPPEYFANSHNVVTLDDWAACDPNATDREFALGRREWGDVKLASRPFREWLATAGIAPKIITSIDALGAALDLGREPCPWGRDYFEQSGDLLPKVIDWVRWKYGTGPIPNRDELLKAFRCEFGNVKNISEPIFREVRRELGSQQSKRGGAPTHRRL